ncbi:MAG: ATP-binding protein [Spirochaetales bacterium]|jgi:predicted ATPase|nr:ATP-binding protein [Spirochaetales bacterium]
MASNMISDFVGREAELTRLQQAFNRIQEGTGRIAALVGEPGIGKTRTATEFADSLTEMGISVSWGKCYEGSGAPVYWPWIQVIRSYIDSHNPEKTAAAMGSGAAAIAEVIPEVADRLGDLPPLKTIDAPLSARFRFFDSITTYLRNLSDSDPIVIMLEDLHWADVTSLTLLEFIAHNLPSIRLLIVITYRDTDLHRKHPLWQSLGDLSRADNFERIPLRGLGENDVHELMEKQSGATDLSSLAEISIPEPKATRCLSER